MIKEIDGSFVYRARRYWAHGRWNAWFEPCPVISHTEKTIKVLSQDFPCSPLYPGGEFTLKRDELIAKGKAYHSRAHEFFHVEKPSQGDLFPSEDILGFKTALEMEVASMGWDLKHLSEIQKDAYIFALVNGCTLAEAWR